MNKDSDNPHLESEYAQIDVRFKLPGLLPVLGGTAVVAQIGLEAGKPAEASTGELAVILLVSAFGSLATLGTLYDQRNSELYNALTYRAKYLEKKFELRIAPVSPMTIGDRHEKEHIQA